MSNHPSSHRDQRTSRELVAHHLERLGRASSTADVLRELESLRPSLGLRLRLSELALPSLTALVDAHLRERAEPARDPLTDTLGARAFAELWRAHAAQAAFAGEEREAVAVAVTLCVAPDSLADPCVASHLKMLATVCVEAVAAGDYVGRTAPTTVCVLPRNGGLHGARKVAARLAEACNAELSEREVAEPLRLEIELRDLAGAASERCVLFVGASQ
jgi:hypothetical protein